MKLLTIFASLGLAAVAFGIPQFAQLAAQTHDISGPDPVNTTNSIDITNSTNPVEATNQIGSPDRVDTANAIDSPDYAYTQTDQWWLRCDYCRFHNNKCKKKTKNSFQQCQQINCKYQHWACANCRDCNCGTVLEPR